MSDRLELQTAPITANALRFRIWGEVLHLFRPLVFIFLARRYKPTSWTPWISSLTVDLIALRCTSLADRAFVDFRDFLSELLNPASFLIVPAYKHDATELARRRFILLFYLLRSPAYEVGLGRVAANAAETFKDAPGLRWILPMVVEQLSYYHRTHFYSSAS